MPHGRKQIRDALITQLTGLATTGARVYADRVEGLPQAELPALIVRTVGEERDTARDTFHGTEIPRRLSIGIAARILTGGDDALDQIALEVETALESNPTLSGKLLTLRYLGAQLQRSSDGDRDHALLILNYEAQYSTLRLDPGQIV